MIFTTLGLHKSVESLPVDGANVMVSREKLPVPSAAHIERGGIIGLYKEFDFAVPFNPQSEGDYPLVMWQRELNASNNQLWLLIPESEVSRKVVKIYAATWQLLGGMVYYVSNLESDLVDIEESLPSFDIRVDILRAMPGINSAIAELLIEKWEEYDSTGREYSFNDVIWAVISGAGWGHLENDIMSIVDERKPERERWLQQLFLGKEKE